MHVKLSESKKKKKTKNTKQEANKKLLAKLHEQNKYLLQIENRRAHDSENSR